MDDRGYGGGTSAPAKKVEPTYDEGIARGYREGSERMEHVRLADVFGRDQSHVKSLRNAASTVALGLRQVASTTEVDQARRLALDLETALGKLELKFEDLSIEHRTKSRQV